MEYLAKKLTNYILKKGIITKETFEIYEYGFQCFLELAASTICSIVIAFFLNALPECLFFFLFFIPLRSYGGGLHMKTYPACFIGSCIIIIITLLLVKYLTIPLSLSFGIYALSAILILIVGPVNHPNRKVDAHDNRIFLKKIYFTLIISLLFAIFFIINKNSRYMFLQSIVFLFVLATSFIGRILYKHS